MLPTFVTIYIKSRNEKRINAKIKLAFCPTIINTTFIIKDIYNAKTGK